MNRPPASFLELELVSNLKANNQLAFSKLYDQYAAILLGVITKIITDKTEAVVLLETTFRRIRLQLDQFRPDKQPLFLWLLQIARTTALDALKERQQVKAVVLQLAESGKVVSPVWQKTTSTSSIDNHTDSVDPQLKALLDAILFKNCTPEEAASSLGLPVETVRQQLRIAMQQLRTISKA
ncbi:hypothetical protein GCM10028808_26310 [Spirosoma migulaei]